MISATPSGKALMTELLAILDEEIGLLNKKRTELENLAEAIVERNDTRMEQLLVEMEQTHQAQEATDIKLDALRNALAAKLDCPPAELKLSRLIEQLDGDDRLTVDYRRQQIILLAEQLRRRHMETAMLLMEAGRINHMLLETLFPQTSPVTTYSPDGPSSWRPDAGLLDAEL